MAHGDENRLVFLLANVPESTLGYEGLRVVLRLRIITSYSYILEYVFGWYVLIAIFVDIPRRWSKLMKFCLLYLIILKCKNFFRLQHRNFYLKLLIVADN